ncbi:MAG: hypothetical protein C4532_09090 [Candidatus Abyssobacteria bacterium SURF_17]|jgi:DUF438 domain-containing protein|uniref:PAS domain-containing protein n=1 Tax=Candidatus Abyssobacteria bacterium SURF_17 TaxID=2093361 RepID=A0A419EZJ3_9BACT|nr:MAG: hypothetical protein C4532_09090 [Candidatus Abyssubacteria bacterium SURF_17]
MIENLTKEQIEGMFDALPFQMLFVDANDRVQFWNNSKARLLAPPEDVVGKDVRGCHQEKSLPRLEQILTNLKSGAKDEEEFWVSMEDSGLKALNRFLAIRDKDGNYLGTMEYLLNFTYLNQIAEDKKDAHKYQP